MASNTITCIFNYIILSHPALPTKTLKILENDIYINKINAYTILAPKHAISRLPLLDLYIQSKYYHFHKDWELPVLGK